MVICGTFLWYIYVLSLLVHDQITNNFMLLIIIILFMSALINMLIGWDFLLRSRMSMIM